MFYEIKLKVEKENSKGYSSGHTAGRFFTYSSLERCVSWKVLLYCEECAE